VDELDRANSDLSNLFDSTRVATVFLDQHMVIRSFTPEVGSIYNLIPSDRGRPLTDIVSRLHYNGLRDDVSHVLETLEPLERRVSRQDGAAHYLLRILPYRTPDSTVDGALVTFVEVTGIVQAEQHQACWSMS
jgi:two-component system CheB/CheR fusion protein